MAVLFSQGAYAQETSPSSRSWAGPYIGLHAGVSAGDLGYTILPVLPGDVPAKYRLNETDFAAGVHAGFNFYVSNRWLAGLEVGYTEGSAGYAPFAAGGFGDLAVVGSSYSISGRFGLLATPDTFVYAKVGYAGIKIEGEEGINEIAKDTVAAVNFGLGVETFLIGNLTGRVEATYSDTVDDLLIVADAERFEPSSLNLMMGLSYHFDASNPNSKRPEFAAPALSFSGFYLGVGGGYALGETDLAFTTPGATVGAYAARSALANALIGFDIQNGNWVAGIEAEASYMNAEFHDPSQNSPQPNAPTLFATIDGLVVLSGRVGFVASPSTLVYGKVGYAYILAEANEDFFPLGGGGDLEWLSGYQVGLGIETALTSTFTLRLETSYTEATDEIRFNDVTIDPSLVSAKADLVARF